VAVRGGGRYLLGGARDKGVTVMAEHVDELPVIRGGHDSRDGGGRRVARHSAAGLHW